MNRRSILFIINYLDKGGAGKMMKYVANTCANHFEDVRLLSLYEHNRSNDLSTKVNYWGLGDSAHGGIIWRIKLCFKIRKFIKLNNPYVICTFVSDNCFTVRLATLGLRVKVCSAERGDPFTNGRIWKSLIGWTYNHSDYCFFQLEKARDFFNSKIQNKSFVIPNVFIPDSTTKVFDGIRKKTIVSAGRFVKEKRYEVMIEAFAYVHRKHPDYTMIIYGEGPLLDKYKALAEKLGLSDYVSYPGYISGVADSVREDGVFVLSSLYEGMPNSLMEALSVGVPCVSTDCTPGGPCFLTDGGKNGLLVPVNDSRKMADAINMIIETPSLSARLSHLGPTIVNELTDERISRKWIEAFEKILSSNNI